VGSVSFAATVKELTASHSSIFLKIVGIASIDYSLSPLPTDEPGKLEPQGSVMHPDHIVDVPVGISYLKAKAAFGSNYVLLGHSCGATLTFQVVMSHSK
jgi:hypothetical protein